MSHYREGPNTRSCASRLKSVDLLGIGLWYLKIKSTAYSLCPIFGVVQASMAVWLDCSLEVILRMVKKKERVELEIRRPKPRGIQISISLLQSNLTFGPHLEGLFAVNDRVPMPRASLIACDLQNAYFEGFKKGVQVTNLFV